MVDEKVTKRWIKQTSKGFQVVDCDELVWWEVESFIEATKIYEAIEDFFNAMDGLREANELLLRGQSK